LRGIVSTGKALQANRGMRKAVYSGTPQCFYLPKELLDPCPLEPVNLPRVEEGSSVPKLRRDLQLAFLHQLTHTGRGDGEDAGDFSGLNLFEGLWHGVSRGRSVTPYQLISVPHHIHFVKTFLLVKRLHEPAAARMILRDPLPTLTFGP